MENSFSTNIYIDPMVSLTFTKNRVTNSFHSFVEITKGWLIELFLHWSSAPMEIVNLEQIHVNHIQSGWNL